MNSEEKREERVEETHEPTEKVGEREVESGEGLRRESQSRRRRRLIYFLIIIIILIGIIPGRLYLKRYTSSHYYLKFQEAGISHLNKGQYKEAAEEFNKAVKHSPDKFEAHYYLGLTYMKLNNLKPAAKELIEAIKLNPKHAHAHYSLGFIFQQMGKFDFAMKEYFIVMKSFAQKKGLPPPELYDNVGTIYLKMKEYDKAIYAFKRAMEMNEGYYPAYINMGKTYEAMGKKDMAIREYQKVKKMASSKPESRQYVQIAEEQLAQLKKSR